MNGGYPRMVEFIAIFRGKIIRMFFNFKVFMNDMGGVVRGGG
jgi:hypothetical protein